MKVALVGDCLANGGAEKVHALLSDYFHEAGLEVHNCIFMDWITYDYSGSLFNLGNVEAGSNGIFGKIKKFRAFKAFMDKGRFDVVVDFRMRKSFFREWLFSEWVYPKNTLFTVHSGILEFYFPKLAFFARLLYKNKSIIAVSKAIQKEILKKGFTEKVSCLYNPIHLQSIELLMREQPLNEGKFILAVGRMNTGVKQFDKLIQAYAQSMLPHQNVKLIFLGDGEKKAEYLALAKVLGLSDRIIFKGSVENPFPYYHQALYTVLSSKNEGFPNAILESLAVGTPVISFDCFSGPNEIVTNGQNGLLVENQNFKKLTEAMDSLLENQFLYESCKSNSQKSVARFDIEIIGKQWLHLLKNTVS